MIKDKMCYVCTIEDNAGILVQLNSKKIPHSENLPVALLQDLNGNDVAYFFITEDTPQTKEELRFVKGTFQSEIPVKFKDDLIIWANKILSFSDNATGWYFLKHVWECGSTAGESSFPYPKIKDLEIK